VRTNGAISECTGASRWRAAHDGDGAKPLAQ